MVNGQLEDPATLFFRGSAIESLVFTFQVWGPCLSLLAILNRGLPKPRAQKILVEQLNLKVHFISSLVNGTVETHIVPAHLIPSFLTDKTKAVDREGRTEKEKKAGN